MTEIDINTRASVVVMISGRGSNLAALIAACCQPDYPATIVGVISDREDAGGLKIAEAAGIDTVVLQRGDFVSRSAHEAAILRHLDMINPDLICLAGYMRILSADFVNRYQGKILNIHPSLLPKYPGLNTHQRALDAGDKEHGCTVHFVDEALDAGPVVAQSMVRIEPGDSEKSLADKVLKIEHALYVDAVRKVLTKFT